MTAAVRTFLLLSLLAAASCGRRSETIGKVITSIGGDAGTGGSGGSSDAAGTETPGDGGGGAGPDVLAAACEPPASAVIPVGSPPQWNCNGDVRCLREPDFAVEPAVFDTAAIDAEPARRPVIVYPLAGSVHPVNLSRLTVQWRRSPGIGQSAFRIRISPASGMPYTFYVGRREPPPQAMPQEADAIYELPEPAWRAIASANAGATVNIDVTAYDTLVPRIATSPSIAISFSARPLEGGLHFLVTEPPQAGINRHLFGTRSAHVLVPRSVTPGPMDCVGCHSPSRDGKTLAYADTYAGNLAVVRTGDLTRPIKAPNPSVPDGLAPAISPDGHLVVARDMAGNLTVHRDGVQRNVATRSELGGRIDYPEWSPDGTTIVASRSVAPVQPSQDYSAFDGELVLIRFEADELQTPPKVLLAEPGQALSHPSWSPDGKWIVFVSSPVMMETHRQPRTRLRLVSADGDQQFTLEAASAGDNAATYPKFAPVGQKGCQLLFVAFQSRLQYGLIGRRSSDLIWPQLWMTALDLTNPVTGSDPSTPPVWLPFQEVNNKNLLPAWSEAVPCNDATLGCGDGAACVSGHCVVQPL